MSDFFDHTRSVMQARWRMPDAPMEAVERIARQHNVPEIIARLVCTRGVAEENIETFLNPKIARDFPDPFALAGMQKTAEYLADAIEKKHKIFIFGDFDVDGATSSAILARFLRHFGLDAPIYIPGRLTEGYGPNAEAFKIFKEQGAQIVILLDCGTTAFEPIQTGQDLGLEIIILDHHEAESALPAAKHIINPKKPGDTSGFTMLAACGVTFLTCIAVNKILRERGFFKNIVEPSLKGWIDLVALGTVCDMVPLTGPNRLFVRAGFAQMHNTSNVGLRALINTAGLKGPVTTYHAGFVLGPRINAGSRVHKSDLGAILLSTDNAEEASGIAWTLHDCNEKRKEMQIEMERAAIDRVATRGLDQNPVIIIDDENMHAGLTGLVAGKLKDKYSKPVCIISYTENPHGVREGRGSGRSVPGIHIAKAFMDARAAGLIEKGGGHAMAGGFTILPEKLDAFRAFMNEHVTAQMNSTEKLSNETLIEGLLTVRGLRADFVRLLNDRIGPFGQEHPEPLFLLQNVRIQMADIVGANHVRVTLGDLEGGANIKAVAFKALGTPLGDALMQQGRPLMHICGYLKLDTWQGRERVEMHIRDAAFAMAEQQAKAI
ncbi:MAG: single-stranded-DNA-specific exonuclease RecJ [Alphaproteobacteria bacterium]